MIKPGIPLPWNVRIPEGGDHAFIEHGDRSDITDLTAQFVASVPLWGIDGQYTAAYIAHAANLYPELVEALRSLLGTVVALSDQQAMPDEFWRVPVETASAILARAEGGGT